MARAQGAEYSLFFHIYVGSDHILGLQILNVNILGFFFQKNEYFGGMDILWIFLGSHYKTGLVLGVISMHFRVFP